MSDIKVYCAYDKMVSVKSLKPNPQNPNTHSKSQIELLGKIIENQGWRQPIKVSNRSGLIVSGHGRYQAAKLIGADKVPVDYQDYDSDEAEFADLMADNRIAELAEIDDEALATLFEQIDLDNFDVELTGYTQDDLDIILSNLNDNILDDFDLEKSDESIPKITSQPITTNGDIWLIGKHRLICGDSTLNETYQALLEGKKADLIITDPPYNVNYEGKTKDALKISNDNMGNEEFSSFLNKAFNALSNNLKDGGSIYVFHADSEGLNFRKEFVNAGFLMKQCLVWVKNTFVMGRQDYQWKHEPILYGWKGGLRTTLHQNEPILQ